MKRISLTLVLAVGFIAGAFAQISDPVKWSYNAKKIADKTYEVVISASIEKGWHLYAQETGEGPVPTTFKFTKNPLVGGIAGNLKEKGKLQKEYDPNFKSVLKFYSNQVFFTQVVKVKTAAATVLKGSVEYMVCNDHQCLPPKEISFSVNVGGK
jgi:DsbC/DsbD-like thiol-disulfide interchange protein